MSFKIQIGNKESLDKVLSVTLPGTVEKVVSSADPREAEKAQIQIDGAEPLYREIRVANALKDESGQEVKLKEGAHVDVTIKADAAATTPKELKATMSTTLYKWHEPFQAALLEFHTENLKLKLEAAEIAIQQRLQELSGEANHSEERNHIQQALKDLRALQTQRLGYPILLNELPAAATTRRLVTEEKVD